MRIHNRLPAFAAAMLCLASCGCDSSDGSSNICFCDADLKAQYADASAQNAEAERQREANHTTQAEIAALDAEIAKAKNDYIQAVSDFTDNAGEIIDKAMMAGAASQKQIINVTSELLFTDDDELQNQIARSIARQQRSLTPCFEMHKIQMPQSGAKATVHIGFVNGKPSRALITSSDILDLGWQNCITTGILKWYFPTTSNKITISNEFRFTADKSVGKSGVHISANVVEGTYKQDSADNGTGSEIANEAPKDEAPAKAQPTTVAVDPKKSGALTIHTDAGNQAYYYIDGKLVSKELPVDNYQINAGSHSIRAYFLNTRKFSRALEVEIEKGYHTTIVINTNEDPKILSKTKIPKKSSDKKPSASKTSKRSTKRPADSSFVIPF